MNPLQAIPAQYRSAFYVAYGLAVLVVGCVQTWFLTAGDTQPKWLLGILGVLAYLGGALGFTAASNVHTNWQRPGRHVKNEAGLSDAGLIAVAALIIVVLVVILR